MEPDLNILNYDNLINLSTMLYNTNDENYIYNTILLSLMGKFGSARGAIYQQAAPDSNDYQLLAIKGKAPANYLDSLNLDMILSIASGKGQFYQFDFDFQIEDKQKILLLLSSKISGETLNEDEMKYAQLVIKIAIAAIKNARNFNQLKETELQLNKQNQLLSSLIDINKDYSSVTSQQEIVKYFSYRLMGQLMISKFALWSLDEDGNFIELVNRFKYNFSNDTLSELFAFNSSTPLLSIEAPIWHADDLVHYVPMYHNSDKKGILFLGKKMNNEAFTDDNINYVEALASATIAALENQRLFLEVIDKKNMERELDLALEIQQKLLPKEIPYIPGYSISGMSVPSQQVGGDYYDIIQISEEKYLITIADVSGKGMPAALLMANVQAAFRSLAPVSNNLSDLLNRVNKIVYQNTSPDKFVTMFVALLNTRTHTIDYINAGHNPPLYIYADSDILELSAGGLILGLFDDYIHYETDSIPVRITDTICLYTDGIVEAHNTSGQEYGGDRLANIILHHQNTSSDLLLEKIIQDVSAFSNSNQLYDDQTLVLIKRV